MMSDTYARVMEEGRERWTFERAQLITEFKDTKSPFPPPLNVLWALLVELPQHWGTREDEIDVDGFKTVPDLKLQERMREEEEVRRAYTCGARAPSHRRTVAL